MRLSAIALLVSTLVWTSSLAQAHSPVGQRAEFTPALDSAEFKQVLQECVNKVDPAEIQLRSGLGDARFPLVTLGPTAEEVEHFYSQGFALLYGFNFPDSIQAFRKAATLDPGAVMPYWGIAVAANSNINSSATQGCNRLSYRASQVALKNAQARLIDPAARSRYSVEVLEREVAYAEAFASLFEASGEKIIITDATQLRHVEHMKLLSRRYEDDLDAATLYANALLNVTPWQWWKGSASAGDDVKPTPEAETAMQVLNKVLMQDAQHAGANHFYIHVIEESPFSDSGQRMADRLPRLLPASGHLVHMASHIYQRTGDNASASAANYAAIAADRALAKQNGGNSLYLLHYLGHNLYFLSWTLAIEGRRNEALNIAEELVENTRDFATDEYLCRQFPEEIQVKSDYFFAVPFYIGTRFHAWDYVERMAGKVKAANDAINQVCRAAQPNWQPLQMPYSTAMLAYSRAYRALGNRGDEALAPLRQYWTAVRSALSANPALQYGSNPALQLFRIANVILLNRAMTGERDKAITLAVLRQQMEEVVGGSPAEPLTQDLPQLNGMPSEVVLRLWEHGVELQDALNYNEPPDWYYTLRESHGYALLAQGQAKQAQRVFTADLKDNRGSGRSLAGLKLSMKAQGKTIPQWLESQLESAWRQATVSATPEP